MATTTDRMPGAALLTRELERCGWKRVRSGPLEGDLLFQTARGAVRAPSALFHSDRGDPLLMVDLSDFTLGGREELYPRFLDFSLETRMALGGAALIASARYLLLLSAVRIELFRLPEETLAYCATNEREFEDELLPGLAARSRSRSEALGTVPNPLEAAQALRGWLAHWGRRLADPLQVEPKDCEAFLWKLILMLQVTRKTGKSEMLGGWGLGAEKLGDTWTLSYASLNTLADLNDLIDDFDQTFSTRMFSGDAELHKSWLGRLDESSLAEQLRAEILMQSQMKFEAETVAWLHADMEREQAGWRREVAGLGPMRKRITTRGWIVVEPLVCDVGRDGVTAALRDADRLADHWRDYEAYCQQSEPPDSEASYSQPDLFFDAPRGVGPRNQLDDGINFLFSGSLRLKGVPPEEEFAVGVAFLLKGLAIVQRCDWPFFGIDTLDKLRLD